MRAIMMVILVGALFAVTASAEVGTPRENRGMQDQCAENNARVPGSCLQLPPGAVGQQSGVVVYIDTGRADGRFGMWQEDNGWSGLQKLPFYGDAVDPIVGDHELL